MARYTATVATPWSAEKAFAYIADVRNFEKWDPGVDYSKLVAGTTPGLDAEYEVKVMAAELTYRTVEFEPSRRTVVEAETPLLYSYDIIEVTPTDEGSVVRYDATFEVKGLAGQLANPLVGLFFDQIGDKAIGGLITALDGTRLPNANDGSEQPEINGCKRLADSALEATIVGSFTKIGFDAREQIFDWEPVTTDLTGQTAIVTGGTSGIGKAIAAGLIDLGAHVYVTSRSQDRAEAAAAELNAGTTQGSATGKALDTGDFDSIESFASDIASAGSIDMLISNAGALTADYRTDARGNELTLSTHLIGPWLLINKLKPALVTGARVLFMSSGGMYTQGLDVDTIDMDEDRYKGAVAYARAKRGQVELVTHLAPEWAPDVLLHAVHPGWVATAGVDAGLPGFGKVMGPLLRDADQGADTMIWLAATGAETAEPGQFWLDRQPRGTAYLPGTATTTAERRKLIEWLNTVTELSA